MVVGWFCLLVYARLRSSNAATATTTMMTTAAPTMSKVSAPLPASGLSTIGEGEDEDEDVGASVGATVVVGAMVVVGDGVCVADEAAGPTAR